MVVAVNLLEEHVVAQEEASKKIFQKTTTKSLLTEKLTNKILGLINSIAIKVEKIKTKLQ